MEYAVHKLYKVLLEQHFFVLGGSNGKSEEYSNTESVDKNRSAFWLFLSVLLSNQRCPAVSDTFQGISRYRGCKKADRGLACL